MKKPRAEKCNPDLMGLATPWACWVLQKKTRPLIAVWVLGAFGRMVVRPEQTSLSADLFSG